MKRPIFAFAFAFALASPAFANTHKEAPNMQQNKMAECNKEASDKKGDERKTFMKTCLGAKPMSQQDKMKTCNTSAKDKKGDERKAFMKECLGSKA